MNKIDHRKHYGTILDTETANGLDCPLPYDFGFAVIDTKGNIYEKFSFVNSDIFVYERDLMQTAYYADKIPQYIADLRNKKRTMANTYEIRKAFTDVYKKYNCTFVVAHNARFDVMACNNIQRWTTKSKYRWFFPYGAEIWDTLEMAKDILPDMPTYQQFCEDNDYLYGAYHNRVRLTAEVIYQFITQDVNFLESHTGLEDVEIEAQIFAYLVRQHKKMRKRLY